MNLLASLALVAASTAAALGLGAVTVSLLPSPGGADDAPWARVPPIGAGGAAAAVWSREVGHDRAPPTTMPWDQESEPVWAVLPRGSATGQWASPLYPKLGVPLWDRIRISSPKDRRAFLLGTAIQVHAPAAAATPGPQSALPHGVD